MIALAFAFEGPAWRLQIRLTRFPVSSQRTFPATKIRCKRP
jgi:hypothetical protein